MTSKPTPAAPNAQLTYWALDSGEPSGKPLSECRRVKVALTLISPEDGLIFRKYGLAALRQYRIKRLTREAASLDAMLTYEDLADILTSSVSTIFRDISELRRQGEFIPTRGQVKDIGRNINNKLQMIQLYCEQVDYAEIARRFHRTTPEVERQIACFNQTVLLFNRKMPPANIAKVTGLALSLVRNYLLIAEQFKLLEKTGTEPQLTGRAHDP